MEALLIGAAIKSRTAWLEADALLEKTDLAPLAQLIWTTIGEYYNRDPQAEGVNRDTLRHLLEPRFPNPKHFDLCKHFLDSVPSDVSPDNIVALVREHRTVKVGLILAQALSTNNEVEIRKNLPCYLELKSSSDSALQESADSFSVTSAEDLMKHSTGKQKILLAPSSLNQHLDGGAERGHVVLVYARPETGKTLFLVNLIAGFLRQGLKPLYLANEEPLRLTLYRLISRLSGMTKQEILANPAEADARVSKLGYTNLYAAYNSGMTCDWIEDAVHRIKPDVTIVDQMRNIKDVSDSRVMQLETVARRLREVAGAEDTLMIYSTQAGDSANNKLVLDMGDVDFSNTGVPGAVDCMIGIGMNGDYDKMGQRMLSLPKNKISGDHSFFPVQVDPTFSKVSSI